MREKTTGAIGAAATPTKSSAAAASHTSSANATQDIPSAEAQPQTVGGLEDIEDNLKSHEPVNTEMIAPLTEATLNNHPRSIEDERWSVAAGVDSGAL